MSANKINAGDIFLIRFHPSVGSELKKFRPGCIISEKVTTIDNRFVLIAPLTTHTKKMQAGEVQIKNPALDKPSLLLTWYLQTIDAQRLEKKLGQLTQTQLKKVSRQVKSLF